MEAPVQPTAQKSQQKLSKENIKEFLQSDRAILMICISIAFVFWLMTKLSYSYKDTLIVKLNYETPADKIFTNPPATQLEVDIEGKGWDLLGFAFYNKERVVNIPVSANEIRVISVSSLNAKVLKSIPKARILNIHPETIKLQMEDIATKVIPVVLEEQVRLAPLYQFVDSIKIEPQKIEIKGPASVIRDINEWRTNVLLPPSEVNQDIDVEIGLQAHPNGSIALSTNKIRCMAKVEEVTEKRIEVPVEVLNVPDSLLLIILPKTVEVSSQVGLSDYDRLAAQDFKVIADFSKIDIFKERSIRVLLKEKPAYAKQVKCIPKKVDYIIRSRNLK
ncbi:MULTISPECIES: CdaR family protein [unclassified Aureispira]|uniref:CdaR family protein n=1 Tax=unclassified Aureispira TaxID=2649989 RepID=UPI0007C70AC3|nr:MULTISPECIES: CdaR family protein [unclassified Aureispira]WMX12081.1 CdaR family protein [Aureispira sp. CCB-E]